MYWASVAGIILMITNFPRHYPKQYMLHAVHTVTRFNAGDQSMHADIDRNLASQNLVHRLSREALSDVE